MEQALLNLNAVSLEMPPADHKADKRIRTHVFLRMLACYRTKHMIERLSPLLDKQRHRQEIE